MSSIRSYILRWELKGEWNPEDLKVLMSTFYRTFYCRFEYEEKIFRGLYECPASKNLKSKWHTANGEYPFGGEDIDSYVNEVVNGIERGKGHKINEKIKNKLMTLMKDKDLKIGCTFAGGVDGFWEMGFEDVKGKTNRLRKLVSDNPFCIEITSDGTKFDVKYA